MRIAALLIISAIATPAFAQQPRSPNQGVSVERPRTGTIAICQTGSILDINVSSKTLIIKGGHVCSENEQPSVILDHSGNIVGGTNTGIVSITFSY